MIFIKITFPLEIFLNFDAEIDHFWSISANVSPVKMTINKWSFLKMT